MSVDLHPPSFRPVGRVLRAAATLCLGLLASIAVAETPAELIVDVTELPGGHAPTERHVVSGQPSEMDLENAANAGLETVINMRGADESAGYDMRQTAADLGLRYHAIPVAGADGLTPEAVQQLDEALAEASDDPVLLHCASGNRVGAMMALRANWLYDVPPDEALELGLRYGLTSLEPAVRERLVTR